MCVNRARFFGGFNMGLGYSEALRYATVLAGAGKCWCQPDLSEGTSSCVPWGSGGKHAGMCYQAQGRRASVPGGHGGMAVGVGAHHPIELSPHRGTRGTAERPAGRWGAEGCQHSPVVCEGSRASHTAP